MGEPTKPSEHTGFSRREDREKVSVDPLEKLRKQVIENRYQGPYKIEGFELISIIERLQRAEKFLRDKGYEVTPNEIKEKAHA